MKKKYSMPSMKMREALADEGLTIHWPKRIKDESNLIIEAFYSTGNNCEKVIFLDLRYEYDLSTESGTDKAIAAQLREANEDYSVDAELSVAMMGKPEKAPRTLFKDFKEAKRKLERFDRVADAIANGNPMPQGGDNKVVTIPLSQARKIASLMKKDSMSWEEFKTLKALAIVLENKIAELEG